MKLHSKLLLILFISVNCHARAIVVFTYSKKSKAVNFILDELRKSIPTSLITSKERNNACRDDYKQSILHLCFESELKVVRSNPEVLKKSFVVLKKKTL